ncbi:MAG: response regulator [Blastocatellia bacterium]|nr:response regulator [Blastocatellia bacterium]
MSKIESVRAELRHCRILIVDDEPANVRLLEKLLHHERYEQVRSLTDSRSIIEVCHEYKPDLLLLDYHMPHNSGLEVLAQLHAGDGRGYGVPVIVLTADMSEGTRRASLEAGARDFVVKPIDPIETLLRVENLLETKFLHDSLARERDQLEQKVLERTHELEAAQLEIVDRLAGAAEFRDDDTRLHTQRVGVLAARVAERLGIAAAEVAILRRAAPLHDVGKIAIPDEILLKPGRLTDNEMQIMRTHVTIGAQILSNSHFAILQRAEVIARTHHERWDGKGYLQGLKGEEIPFCGRLTAVIDVFDALTGVRPYKAAWPVQKAIDEIKANAGTQFDPAIVDALLQVISPLNSE